MKILVLAKPIPGVAREKLLKHASAEVRAVWKLYEQGIYREFYTRVSEGRVMRSSRMPQPDDSSAT